MIYIIYTGCPLGMYTAQFNAVCIVHMFFQHLNKTLYDKFERKKKFFFFFLTIL